MTTQELARRQAVLLRLALRINADVEKPVLALLAKATSDISLPVFERACEKLGKTEKYWPAEATIREAARATFNDSAALQTQKLLADRANVADATPEAKQKFKDFMRTLQRPRSMPPAKVGSR